MSEIGFGLFNRDLLKSIKSRWHSGGFAVLYIHLNIPSSNAESALHNWENNERLLFWRQRMEGHYFFLFSRDSNDHPIDIEVELALSRIRDRLRLVYHNEELETGVSGERWFSYGRAIAYPLTTDRSTETVVYQMILNAVKQSANLSDSNPSVVADTALKEPVHARNGHAIERMYTTDSILIGELATEIPTFNIYSRVSEVAYYFDTQPKVQGAVIIKDGKPVGLVMKEKLHQLLAGQFGLPLYWNRSVKRIMNENPLLVDESCPVEQVSQQAMARDFSQLYDVVIITRENTLIGAASIRSILEYMTTLRMEEARRSNPLTGLPGNSRIQMEMRNRIQTNQPLAIIYIDLDYFKWFNDCFGFGAGDDLIRYVSTLLQQMITQLGTKRDFIGHIGGDDFIAIVDPDYVEAICQQTIKKFDEEVITFYDGLEISYVEDRHGNIVHQEGVTISMSVLLWDGQEQLIPDDIPKLAARLKKRAKALRGSVYIVEQVTALFQSEGRRRT